jgi:hypothetical protein
MVTDRFGSGYCHSAADIAGPNRMLRMSLTDYEEITVLLMIQDVGGYEIDALYADASIYVNVATLFNILKINYQLSAGNDSVFGFFLEENNRYT